MKLFRLAAFAAVLSVAACTSSPTESIPTQTAAPSFDADTVPASGGGIGASTASSDSTARTGLGLGSGN